MVKAKARVRDYFETKSSIYRVTGEGKKKGEWVVTRFLKSSGKVEENLTIAESDLGNLIKKQRAYSVIMEITENICKAARAKMKIY